MVVLRALPWEDPPIDRLGATPFSSYVERFWLPLLGPSATLLLRRVAAALLARPPAEGGVDLGADELARSLGLGGTGGRHAPFPRALGRLMRYGLARLPGPAETIGTPGTVVAGFRLMVPPLPQRQLARLPEGLRAAHADHVAVLRVGPGPAAQQRRARRVACEVALQVSGPAAPERALAVAGLHPSLWAAATGDAAMLDGDTASERHHPERGDGPVAPRTW
jgi:hypothetical protein